MCVLVVNRHWRVGWVTEGDCAGCWIHFDLQDVLTVVCAVHRYTQQMLQHPPAEGLGRWLHQLHCLGSFKGCFREGGGPRAPRLKRHGHLDITKYWKRLKQVFLALVSEKDALRCVWRVCMSWCFTGFEMLYSNKYYTVSQNWQELQLTGCDVWSQWLILNETAYIQVKRKHWAGWNKTESVLVENLEYITVSVWILSCARISLFNCVFNYLFYNFCLPGCQTTHLQRQRWVKNVTSAPNKPTARQ